MQVFLRLTSPRGDPAALHVERLSDEMMRLHPGMPRAEYVRVSFIAVNSVMGVVHTMMYDENQVYETDELSRELKIMLKAYFEQRRS